MRTLAKGSPEAQYCELDVVPGDLNRYTLTGCLTQRADPSRWPLPFRMALAMPVPFLKMN